VDFVLRPENYERRREVLVETVEAVRRLWRREEMAFTDGTGETSAVRIFPPPVQDELPVWLTSAGSQEGFRTAGRLGAGVLTHLIGQGLDGLEANIAAYRKALREEHGDSARGTVSLMLHTLLGEDREAVREAVREPFSAYLRSSIGLIMKAGASALPEGLDPARLSERDRDFLVARSFDRYFDEGGLFGTVDDACRTVGRLRAAGVDEIACLIDFGVPDALVMAGLEHLDTLRRRTAAPDETWEAPHGQG
jgi:natural product biosynthesis luciferase-like monooxygenase protein